MSFLRARTAFPSIRLSAPRVAAAYSTTPHAPPPEKKFFASSTIKPEVRPLIFFVGALLTIATGAAIHHLTSDGDLRLTSDKPLVDENREELEKVINSGSSDTRTASRKDGKVADNATPKK